MHERFAIYFAPATTSPLWSRATQWLGRDPASGAEHGTEIAGLGRERLAALTVSARRYGFHATIKPPMALAEGTDRAGLERELGAFCRQHRDVPIGRLKLSFLDGFLALVPELQSRALTEFAAECVVRFDRFRRPMSPAERDKRIHPGLGAHQIALLDRFGYPYVLDQFLFHMTLSDRLAPDEREDVMRAAQEWFAPLLGQQVVLDRLALFREAVPGGQFARVADFPLSVEVKADA